MKINNLLLLGAPITVMALPSNVTHAAQSDAPIPADHLDRNIGIGLGCIGAAAFVGYVGINIYKHWRNDGAKL